MRLTNAGLAGDCLNFSPAGGGQLGLALQRVVLVVLDSNQRRGELVGPVIGRGLFLGRLIVGADDQRRSGLVDQDAVGLVDDREIVGALHRQLPIRGGAPAEVNLLEGLAMRVAAELKPLQLVAQEVETQLLGRSVGDVAGIGGAPDRDRSARSECSRRSSRAVW